MTRIELGQRQASCFRTEGSGVLGKTAQMLLAGPLIGTHPFRSTLSLGGSMTRMRRHDVPGQQRARSGPPGADGGRAGAELSSVPQHRVLVLLSW